MGFAVVSGKLLLLVLAVSALSLSCAYSVVVVYSGSACSPGEYAYNQSGSVVCLPAVNASDLPFFSFNANLNGSTLYLYVSCSDPRGCDVLTNVMDGNGSLLFNGSVKLKVGNYYSWDIALGKTYDYVILNFTVNNYQFGPYAVAAPSVKPVINYSSLDPRVATLILIGAVAPLIAVTLRHNPREAGIALVGLSFVYMPIMYAFNIPYPIPPIIISLTFITGVALIATTKT